MQFCVSSNNNTEDIQPTVQCQAYPLQQFLNQTSNSSDCWITKVFNISNLPWVYFDVAPKYPVEIRLEFLVARQLVNRVLWKVRERCIETCSALHTCTYTASVFVETLYEYLTLAYIIQKFPNHLTKTPDESLSNIIHTCIRKWSSDLFFTLPVLRTVSPHFLLLLASSGYLL